MTSRAEVYAALDSERAYQAKRWNEQTTTSGGHHSFSEWIAYMEHYLNLAKEQLATRARQDAYPDVAHIMRKVTAMGVAAMEEHGAPQREGFPVSYYARQTAEEKEAAYRRDRALGL